MWLQVWWSSILLWTVNDFVNDSKIIQANVNKGVSQTLADGDIFYQLFSLQLVLPEYLIHFFFCVMFFCAAEWLTLCLNLPLLAYHVWRWVSCKNKPIVLTQHLVLLYISLLLMQQTCTKCSTIWLNTPLFHCAAGIWADLWWAAQDSMTQQPSWMLTFWPSVKKRAGANWHFTSCHSSTISMGTKYIFFLGCTFKKKKAKNRTGPIWKLV